MSGDTQDADGFFRLVSQPFQVTTYQIAAALHDPCPLRGCASSARDWEHCTRAFWLVDRARSLLERATEKQVVPKLRATSQVPVALSLDDLADRSMRGLWEEA